MGTPHLTLCIVKTVKTLHSFVILLQDHGFGGDYSAFGAEGLMARIAQRTERFPSLLLVARNTNPWENYEALSVLEPTYGGMQNESRQLFSRVIK